MPHGDGAAVLKRTVEVIGAVGDDFEIHVILPDAYDASNGRYPVVYFLDGYDASRSRARPACLVTAGDRGWS